MQIDRAKLEGKMKGWTVEMLAVKVNCTAQTIHNIRRGKGCWPKTAKAIARALKCKLEDITV